MTFSAYATRDDVYLLGLSAQAFVVRPRPFESVTIANGTIRLTAHGLSAADLVEIVGTSGGTMPGGVASLTQYAPIVVGSDLFRLTGVGSFSAAGSGWAVAVDAARRLDAHLEQEAAVINQHLTAHAPPIEVDPVTGKYPPILVGLNARRAARAAVISLQIENAAYRVAVDRLFAREDKDDLLLAQLRDGWPLLPRPVDQTPATADNGARAAAGRLPAGWTTGRL